MFNYPIISVLFTALLFSQTARANFAFTALNTAILPKAHPEDAPIWSCIIFLEPFCSLSSEISHRLEFRPPNPDLLTPTLQIGDRSYVLRTRSKLNSLPKQIKPLCEEIESSREPYVVTGIGGNESANLTVTFNFHGEGMGFTYVDGEGCRKSCGIETRKTGGSCSDSL
ncbi:hypothetical protein BGZ60DRAFT_522686 [Tricladium varicosporioides]|nr:hypothetical protein BGZ60DRAFT_522686 [Hymenoscyphus varicosporioides]